MNTNSDNKNMTDKTPICVDIFDLVKNIISNNECDIIKELREFPDTKSMTNDQILKSLENMKSGIDNISKVVIKSETREKKDLRIDDLYRMNMDEIYDDIINNVKNHFRSGRYNVHVGDIWMNIYFRDCIIKKLHENGIKLCFTETTNNCKSICVSWDDYCGSYGDKIIDDIYSENIEYEYMRIMTAIKKNFVDGFVVVSIPHIWNNRYFGANILERLNKSGFNTFLDTEDDRLSIGWMKFNG